MSHPSLLTHRQAEFALVADLDRLQALAATIGMPDLAARTAEMRDRITTHKFIIAVVGEFKRGKSTFINALLGKDILPADIAPASATINRITYGLVPSASVIFRGATEEQAIDIARLEHYVTKLTPEAEAMAATVEQANVYYPIPFCKQNIDIIDTPGLSDEIAMSEVTFRLLPRVDAAVFVLMATAPFSQTEASFLELAMTQYGLRSFLFVVTGIDKIRTPGERERILAVVTSRIEDTVARFVATLFPDEHARADFLRTAKTRVFAVSGYDALQAKMNGDEAALQRSGLPVFESALEDFLSSESGLVSLRLAAERINGFAVELTQELNSRLNAALLPIGESFEDDAPHILRSLQWLIADSRTRIEEQRVHASITLRTLITAFPREFERVAEETYPSLNLGVQHLEIPALSSYLRALADHLKTEFDEAIESAASSLLSTLGKGLSPVISNLSLFISIFDRVMLHLSLGFEASLAPAPPSPAPTMASRLGLDAGLEAPETEIIFANLFPDEEEAERCSAFTQSLMFSIDWADDVSITPQAPYGPNFTRSVTDQLRLNNLRGLVRTAFSEATAVYWQRCLPAHRASLNILISHYYAVLDHQFLLALTEVDHQLALANSARERRANSRLADQERFTRFSTEMLSMRQRLQDMQCSINAI
ncbi:dynamin family protein [Granulicella sibirica]|uniref:Putative GTPase n=1 Tax=Granulicella sibirica TaxID=2479048 RepID=A0A4Q0SV40_9BACT|nr:dynamin family protein [Granulicella sibirica]RXH54212.1 putative GTPase [Granulicella sibirica]